jgi:hypothetical protein
MVVETFDDCLTIHWLNFGETKMTTKKTTDITFRVFRVGSNMPGYMPDEPPHPHASFEDARGSLVWDIGRDIDDIASGEWSHEGVELMAELERFAEYCKNCEPSDIGGTVGNRHYFLSEDTMTGQELEDCDCDPSDYEPILDEWITPEELEALESYGISTLRLNRQDSDSRNILAVTQSKRMISSTTTVRAVNGTSANVNVVLGFCLLRLCGQIVGRMRGARISTNAGQFLRMNYTKPMV